MTAPQRFAVRSRILHWLTALGVFSALLIGFAMVNSIGSYAALLTVHMTIGISILAVTVLRIVNRRITHPPAWPPTVGRLEGRVVTYSERLMYALLLVQPLVGWAMVSAAGRPPVVVGGLHLPAIAPFSSSTYFILRQTHSVLAYVLVVVIAAHVCAVLLHTLTLRDHMFSRMGFGRSPRDRATTAKDTA
ncbi:cytochrome b [Mycolicibacterium sp. 018/SC-01/001]|uniref:cytochrome b n=1 Tax=Mycolicibacterium sp. 018/SC-01/001 TaxID=2592069 RepID=UPI00117F28EE|nr:cytochrome b [Mycolicibacterium sp. 018/SC-01/001]TRW89078.1 cytochrome b [Mycolicibacterium sp. 018/SC-01/001]